MIRVYVRPESIHITGHAGYKDAGSDIVCAGVSVLFQTMLHALLKLTEDCVQYNLKPGDSYVQYEALSDKSVLLIQAFMTGIFLIAADYPDFVVIEPLRAEDQEKTDGLSALWSFIVADIKE